MRFNSVLGAFTFLVLASFVAFIVFIQTRTFGNLLTKVITDVSQKKVNTEVAIKNINISFYPPGIEFERVKIKKEIDSESKIDIELGKIGFYLSLIELEEKKLSFGEINVIDSVIDYSYLVKKDEPKITELDQDIIKKIFDLSEKLPLRVDTFLFENTKVVVNHELLEVKRLKLFKKNKIFMTRFHLANFKPVDENDFKIDEIWGEAEVGKKNISIQRLRIHQDVHTLLIKGKIKNYPLLRKANIAINGEASIFLKGLEDVIPVPKEIDLKSGLLNLAFNLEMIEEKIKGTSGARIEDLRSNIAFADDITVELSLEENKITLNLLKLKYKDELLSLSHPVLVANLDNKTFLQDKISAHVEKVSLNNALRILGPSLEPLKGKLTGNLDFNYKKGDLYFTPHKNFVVTDLGLIVGEQTPFTVLLIKRAVLNNSTFNLINDEFQMKSSVALENSQLEVVGRINKDRVEFSSPNSKIDFEDFGNISDLSVKGKGVISVNVDGQLDDTIINLKGITKKFEILGYQLGESDKEISIELKDSSVVIKKFESQFGSTHISGTGAINYDNSDINLGINSEQASFHDLTEILNPILGDLDFIPSDFDFTAKVDTSIYGKTSLKNLKVKSKAVFSDLTVYGENFNNGGFKINLSDELLSINDFIAHHGKGSVAGDFSFNLVNDRMKLDYNWKNLIVSSFNVSKKLNINLDGELNGSLTGKGSTKDYQYKLVTQLTNTKASNYEFDDSLVDVKIFHNRLEGTAQLLGKMIESKFDIWFAKEKPSKIGINVSVPEIKPFAVALLGQHLDAQDFTGKMSMSLDSSFNGYLENLTLKGLLGQLSLKHSSLAVDYVSSKPQFVVNNGKVIDWNLDIKQKDLFLVTKGTGTFGHDVSLTHQLNFNSKIFELLLSSVLSSEGFVNNLILIDGDKDEYSLALKSSAKDIDLSLEGVPFPISDLNYSIDYSNNRMLVNELSVHLDNGTATLKGDVFFDNNEPDVNLKFYFDKAEFPILGKSIMNISGEGIILGNESPYNLGGEILLNKLLIVNELNEFGSQGGSLGQVRFLPKNQESPLGKLFNLNLNVKAENLIKISNSMLDVGLRGEITILGNPTRPRGEGRLYSPVNTSRVFFKNSEYFITNADLNFSPKKEISNPDFDIQALTYISSYKVNAKAYGDLERFTFDLTSDPTLPRNSILSLIAFGYTNEIQNSLEAKDQQSLTQVGVGSFVFDQFKISDILKKQFGLQINLGTVLEQSQTDSLLSGRSQGDGQGQSLGRTRSATKIELKKRLDEALTLSVSSTMGGSIGQRQSMNLNYGLSKKVQVEGVYELRTNEEGTEDIISNSIGADLKFRWTFK